MLERSWNGDLLDCAPVCGLLLERRATDAWNGAISCVAVHKTELNWRAELVAEIYILLTSNQQF